MQMKNINNLTYNIYGISLQYYQNVPYITGAIVTVIVWQLDLQLPVQSVPLTTDFVSSNLDQMRGVQNYAIKFVRDLRQIGGFLRVLHQYN